MTVMMTAVMTMTKTMLHRQDHHETRADKTTMRCACTRPPWDAHKTTVRCAHTRPPWDAHRQDHRETCAQDHCETRAKTTMRCAHTRPPWDRDAPDNDGVMSVWMMTMMLMRSLGSWWRGGGWQCQWWQTSGCNAKTRMSSDVFAGDDDVGEDEQDEGRNKKEDRKH